MRTNSWILIRLMRVQWHTISIQKSQRRSQQFVRLNILKTMRITSRKIHIKYRGKLSELWLKRVVIQAFSKKKTFHLFISMQSALWPCTIWLFFTFSRMHSLASWNIWSTQTSIRVSLVRRYFVERRMEVPSHLHNTNEQLKVTRISPWWKGE